MFDTIVTQPFYKLNYTMPCLITAPMISNIKQTTIQKKQTTKLAKTKNSRQKLKI